MKGPITNIIVKLAGKDGNAYSILSRVNKALKKAGEVELAKAFLKEATSGDYDHLLQTCFKYVLVE